MKQLLEHLNIKIIRPEGDNQFLCECPDCQSNHLYVNQTTGLWKCMKGCDEGNPYQLCEKVTTLDSKGIMDLLGKYGLGSGEQPKEPVKRPKKIALHKDQCQPMTDEELVAFCNVKGISIEAYKRVMGKPWRHSQQSWALLPAYNPSESNSKPCGILRSHLEGKLIQTKHGEDKYPQVYGSTHGLFGVEWIMKDKPKDIIFTEGWRDCLAAVEAGFYATASSGGASCWKDEWMPMFQDKHVAIIMDADRAGRTAAERAAKAIWSVAKTVKIINLPYEVTESHGKDLYDWIKE